MARLRMNITINIKFSANILLLTMFALFTYSCTKENEVTGARIYEGEKIPMSIKMGTRNATTDKDEVINSVRAIVFNDKNELVYNDVSDASINVDSTYTASIRAARGYNNIYIICNETSELTEKLSAITLENKIEKVTFSAVGIVAPPPMYGNVARAYVESRSDGKNATVTINNIKMTELPVSVTRMVSRISFTAIKNITNPNEDFKVTKLTVKVCRMPAIQLTDDAKQVLLTYPWPGNVRQLKNITEQISIIETNREINASILKNYLPEQSNVQRLPALFGVKNESKSFESEREILYQVLFDMRQDVTELKKLVHEIMTERATMGNQGATPTAYYASAPAVVASVPAAGVPTIIHPSVKSAQEVDEDIQDTEEYVEESLSLDEVEKEMIRKALEKHHGKRKSAAKDLNISERTLYRKIKEYGLD